MTDPMPAPGFPAPLRPEIESLETSGIMELWQMGFGMTDLIPFWVGEGDQPTPAFICEAAAQAMRDGLTFYTHKRGSPELRAELAAYQNGLLGSAVAPERVTISSSGMNGIMISLQCLVGAGDNVVVVTPIWPNIFWAIHIVGGEMRPVSLEAQPEGGFALDLDRLFDAVDPRTRAIFVASPGNPSGWVMPREQQSALLDFCRQRGIWLIADEVYQRFVYHRPASERPAAPSLLQLIDPEDPVIVANSFSKAWAMTGWRHGWLVHPPSMAETFARVIEYNTSGGQAFLQEGCRAALREGEPFVQDLVARSGRCAELLYQRLSALPRVRLARPEGAFYAFFAVEGVEDSMAFAKRVLTETSVGLAPGSAFGPGGEGHLRLCFACSEERLSAGLDRLATILA